MEQVILFVHDQRETIGDKLLAITAAFGPGAARKVKNIKGDEDLWEFRLLKSDSPTGLDALNEGIDFDVASATSRDAYFELFNKGGRLINVGRVGQDKAMFHLDKGSFVRFYDKVTIYHADQD